MVLVSGDAAQLQSMRWGLIPHWATDEQMGYKMINARGETLREKRAFRGCLQRQRCAIPADSFFEWRKSSTPRQPVRFLLHDREPFFFAGLWDQWKKPDGTTLRSFTIITTEANDLVRRLHDRMPVILTGLQATQWIAPDADATGNLEQWLRPFPASEMTNYPVGTRLNDALVDDEKCVEPAMETESAPMLPGFG